MKISNFVKRLVGALSSLALIVLAFTGENSVITGEGNILFLSGKNKVDYKLSDALEEAKELEVLGTVRILYWIAIVLAIALLVWFVVAAAADFMKKKKTKATISKINRFATLLLLVTVVLFLVGSLITKEGNKLISVNFISNISVLTSAWYWVGAVLCLGNIALELGVKSK